MCDILFSVAWECGDRDCKAQWHRATYWIESDGYTVDNYSDGDHESIAESDLPTQDAIDKSWIEYARYVLRAGVDPLEEYYVKHSRKIRQRWEFRFNNSIAGPHLLGARHAGRDYRWRELPEHIKSYLHITNNSRIRDFETWADFVAAVPTVKLLRWTTFHIEYDKPRAPAVIARDLKKLARRQIKDEKKS